jgi:radical SAM protein (TIGR01212 family)
MKTASTYLKEIYGCKVYRIALSADVTCPNRDGTLGTRGCIFCSAGGSGEFSADRLKPIPDQLLEAKARVASKVKDGRYIAYFQSFTNTYAPVHYLRKIFHEAIEPDDVVILSVATRPDCLSDDVLDLLAELNRIKPVWVELGLQTVHERTAAYIRRGYPLSVYDDAVRRLTEAGLTVITHVILGLPGETEEDMAATVRHVVSSGAKGIKLQLLQILKNTDLADDYYAGRVPVMSMEAYMELLKKLLPLIPDDVIVHRLTGDGPKSLLIAPAWCGDKKRVLSALNRTLTEINS